MIVESNVRSEAEAQLERIRRGSEKILPDEQTLLSRIEASIRERRPLRVKLGIDPTFTDLTLGHTIPLRNLRRFQDLGHQAVLVIGDFTATVGDPTGRSKARPPLTHEEVLANAETYQQQAGRVLDLDKAEVVYNSTWLKELTVRDMIRIGAHVSVKQMLEGEYFGRRFEDPEQTIFLHEMFYPILQGMDSVAIRADIELGGTDQEFNCLMGRQMQRLHGQERQIVVTSPLLPGLSGPEKMSKSLGNFVGVSWQPQEQFNRLMTMSDERMPLYFRLLTDLPAETTEGQLASVREGQADPREVKKLLAREIVAELHGRDAADAAAVEYNRYAELRRGNDAGELPSNIPQADVELPDDGMRLTQMLVTVGLAASNGEAKRLVRQRGVRLRGEIVTDETFTLHRGQADGALLQVGSKTPIVLRERA